MPTMTGLPLERSIPFLLDWFDANRGTGELYWNRISF
jgi:hypothetical protein